MRGPSTEQINEYLAKSGERGGRVLSALGSNRSFVSAIESEVGQQLLMDGLERMEAILVKIINEEATNQELAEFRALKTITLAWGKRIARYLQDINKVVGK